MEEKLVGILNEMAEYLNISQMKKLQEVLLRNLSEKEAQKSELSNKEYLKLFLEAKEIEGCSARNHSVLSRDSGTHACTCGYACQKDIYGRDAYLSC